MKYIIMLFVLFVNYYPLTYSKYLWNTGNRTGALGVVAIVAISIIAVIVYNLFLS
jgi:hypothetical protein